MFRKFLDRYFRTEIKYLKESTPMSRNFFENCAEGNLISAKVILIMMFSMECFMILCYIIQTFFIDFAKFFPQYIYMYVSFCVISLIFLSLQSKIKTPAKLINFQLIILFVIGIWSAVFSYFDIINGYSSYLFVQIIIINSLFFTVNPLKHSLINLMSFAVYAFLLSFSRLNFVDWFAEFINPFLMIIAACIIVFLNFRIKLKNFINGNLIKEQNLKLNYYADHDFLTNILNRKSIINILDNMLKCNKNLSCLLIDVDDFKLYNDTYGHIAGDNCLIRIASIIEEFVLKQGGKVGRYGGEEFLAIFEKTEEDTVKCAEDLVKLVENENINYIVNGVSRTITVSIGIFIKNDTTDIDKNKLLELADIELYNAKREGKNRISLNSRIESESIKMQEFF